MDTMLDFSELYAEVQDFYARQVRLQDGGEVEEFAATFTDDARFAHGGGAPPLRGRAEIIDAARQVNERLARDGVRRRHWFAMMSATPGEEASVRADFYALVIAIREGEPPAIEMSCAVHDVLVRDGDGGLLTRSRTIEPDGASPIPPSR